MILELKNIYKTYDQGKLEVPVLRNISMGIKKGDYVAIMGPSGSGKTTLMNIIGCLDYPSSGSYTLDGENVLGQNDSRLSDIRLHGIGFVFQSFNLMPRLTALENVMLPLSYAGTKKHEAVQIARAALVRVGLADRVSFTPAQLSGGQSQRVAIARAIVNNPKILLADEPTGALDSSSGKQVMRLFKKLNEEGVTVIMITHEREIAEHANTIFYIRDGRLVDSKGNYIQPEDNQPKITESTEKLISSTAATIAQNVAKSTMVSAASADNNAAESIDKKTSKNADKAPKKPLFPWKKNKDKKDENDSKDSSVTTEELKESSLPAAINTPDKDDLKESATDSAQKSQEVIDESVATSDNAEAAENNEEDVQESTPAFSDILNIVSPAPAETDFSSFVSAAKSSIEEDSAEDTSPTPDISLIFDAPKENFSDILKNISTAPKEKISDSADESITDDSLLKNSDSSTETDTEPKKAEDAPNPEIKEGE